VMRTWYSWARPASSNATGKSANPVTAPVRSASAPAESGRTENRPRLASSRAISRESLCSTPTRAVWLASVWKWMILMEGGSVDVRPTRL